MRVLNAAQMREADRRTIEEIGIPSIVLMETAGREAVSVMESTFSHLTDSRVTVLAGRGNNGGDGFVVARLLAARGVDVRVCLVGDAADVRGDARTNLEILGRLGVPVTTVGAEADWSQHAPEALACDLVVDALFGTGLSAPLGGLHEFLVHSVADSGVPVVAIDLPSGLSADSPAPIGPHVTAALTVTLGAPKLPLVLAPGEAAAGTVVVADIGIPPFVFESLGPPDIRLVDRGTARALVPARHADTHKGTYGHVLVVAGSRGKTGAAGLAATGALRSGAGLVTVATPASIVPVVAALGAEFMTLPLAETPDGVLAAAAADEALSAPHDVMAVGPGIGTGPDAAAFVEHLLRRAAGPLVLDADAISVLAGRTEALAGTAERPVVVTPHPGELARLTGQSAEEIQRDRIGAAGAVAQRHGVYVVLKGHRTVLAAPDGRIAINTTGNPGMATGGSGDVLTGMVAAWLAQLRDPWAACRLAVYLHGAAGDLAAAAHGEAGLIAGDIAASLGPALLDLMRPEDDETS